VHADFAGMVLDPPATTAPLRARRWRRTVFWLLLLVFLISVTAALFFLR
jgi:Na+/melibiose symporter-like transporter